MASNLFDNWKPHAHYLGLLMSSEGTSNEDLYHEARAKWKEKLKLFEDMTDKQKDLVMGKKALDASDKAYNEMKRLESIRHIEPLGKTCLSKLDEIYLLETENRKKVIANDYLEKGLMVEEDSITLFCIVTTFMLRKNVVTQENDWVVGTMDIELDEDTVVDVKSSWDRWTFNKAKRGSISTLYKWQLDAYMWLFHKTKAKLAYCLVNTPEGLIRREETRLMYDMFGTQQNFEMAPAYLVELYNDACVDIRRNHIFDDLAPEKRVKIFDTEYVEERIEAIKKRVEYCRWYLNNYEEINES